MNIGTNVYLDDETNDYIEGEMKKYKEEHNKRINKPNMIILKLNKIKQIESNGFS